MVWLNAVLPGEYASAVSDIIMKIKKAFDENDITIPFPIRTLDFGIKGGEKLSEVFDYKSLFSNSDTKAMYPKEIDLKR